MRRAGLLAALALAAGCGSSEPGAAAVEGALEARLQDRNLSYKWVVCVRTAQSFRGRTIFRCNVNFGDPHIVRYCATLEDGELVTSNDVPALRCGRASGA